MLRGKLSTTNLRGRPADPTNSPTINQSSPDRRTGQEPDGRRGRLPRHVPWRTRWRACQYGHHAYRKKLNLQPMQDVGTMSARKFTSRIHD